VALDDEFVEVAGLGRSERVQGEKDPFVNAELVKLLPLAFEHLRVGVFEGCGHWVPEEQPERLVATPKDILRTIEDHK
jgi:pimeloyl-ACP methyl ester carboxylesterase